MHRQGLVAGAGGFGAFFDEVAAEEIAVRGVLVVVLGREHHREHGHARIQLHAHQRVDHGGRDEVVAVNATVHHQRAGHHGRIATAARQALGQERNFKRARHGEMLHRRRLGALRRQARPFGGEAFIGARHHVGVPAGGDPRHRQGGDGRRRQRGGSQRHRLIHDGLNKRDLDRIRAHTARATPGLRAAQRPRAAKGPRVARSLSSGL